MDTISQALNKFYDLFGLLFENLYRSTSTSILYFSFRNLSCLKAQAEMMLLVCFEDF